MIYDLWRMIYTCGTWQLRITNSITKGCPPQSGLSVSGSLLIISGGKLSVSGEIHLTVGRRLANPYGFVLPFLRNGNCAASPHTAALVGHFAPK